MKSCFVIIFTGALVQRYSLPGALGQDTPLWQCSVNAECSTLEGGVCYDGNCVCPPGQQPVEGGTKCVLAAPYYLATCVEDHQCFRLATGYRCAVDEDGEGICGCQAGHHYFLGRCWKSRNYGESCSNDYECTSPLRDPHSLACVDGECSCADGYYLRQRGECRKIGYAVGDECVLDSDCQFDNSACDWLDLVCYDASTSSEQTPSAATKSHNATFQPFQRNLDAQCDDNQDCSGFLTCSNQRHCICPVGYYQDGNSCYAELGSPVTAEAGCGGLFTVSDALCRCPSNFYYEEHMRDCIKATARFGDSCASDDMCLTFGVASVCGAPSEFGLRECECRPELAVKDVEQQICRLFSALGEVCETESDCLAGELQVLCLADEENVRRCSCPEGLAQEGNLCITTGLVLGDECQITSECSGSPFAVCQQGTCQCAQSYVQVGDVCQPAIGGECSSDGECVIENTSCQTVTADDVGSCRCRDSYVEVNQTCLPESAGFGTSCADKAQCEATLGEGSDCVDNACDCVSTHHYRGEYCYPMTGLLDRCDRTPECYLGNISNRVVCRNDFCHCDFDYPYSEKLNTCLASSGSTLILPSYVLAVFGLLMPTFYFCML